MRCGSQIAGPRAATAERKGSRVEEQAEHSAKTEVLLISEKERRAHYPRISAPETMHMCREKPCSTGLDVVLPATHFSVPRVKMSGITTLLEFRIPGAVNNWELVVVIRERLNWG